MSELICNAPFCVNKRNQNHAWCGVHRWEREKHKVKKFKQIILFKIKEIKILPKYCPIKQKKYNLKSAPKRKENRLKKRYNITKKQYDKILESQESNCAICNISLDDFKKRKGIQYNFAVDHCHKTEVVRGLLCFKCNMGLGYFNDNDSLLDRAVNYLRKIKS